MLILTRCVSEFMQIGGHTFALLLRNMEDMECLKLTVKVLNDLTSRIKSSRKWKNFGKFMFSNGRSNAKVFLYNKYKVSLWAKP